MQKMYDAFCRVIWAVCDFWRRILCGLSKSILRPLDRTLTSGLFSQIGVLLTVVVLIFGILWGFAGWILRGDTHRLLDDNPIEHVETVSATKESQESPYSFVWAVYYHFVDPGNQHLAHNDVRWLALIISFTGSLFMSGLLISTFSNIIERRVERVRNGLIYYRMYRHVVILGFDNMVPALVRQIFETKQYTGCDILLQTAGDVEAVRMKLRSELSPQQFKRVVVVYGSRTAADSMRKLCFPQAREVFLLGEPNSYGQEEPAHDSLNIDALFMLGECMKSWYEKLFWRHRCGVKAPLKCNLLLEYQATFTVMQSADIPQWLKTYIDLRPFNYYETWAQKVLVAGRNNDETLHYPSLDREPLCYNSPRRVHFVIVGMSRMGIALAIEAAHVAHYPNFVRDKSRKTLITLIDANMEQEMAFFKGRYKALFEQSHSRYIDSVTGKECRQRPSDAYAHLGEDYKDYIDVEWQFVNGRLESPAVQALLTEWSKEPDDLLTVAVCFNRQRESLAASLYLPDELYRNQIPVWVFQRESATTLLMTAGFYDKKNGESNPVSRYANILPFGMENECFDVKYDYVKYAKRVNYVYDYYNSKRNIPVTFPVSELDEKWNTRLSIQNKWSNIYNANSIPFKLRSVGYDSTKSDAIKCFTPEVTATLSIVEHNRWNVEKLLLGYRPVTEEEQKKIDLNIALKGDYRRSMIHYDIRPYDALCARYEALRMQLSQNEVLAPEYDVALTQALPYIVNGSDVV